MAKRLRSRCRQAGYARRSDTAEVDRPVATSSDQTDARKTWSQERGSGRLVRIAAGVAPIRNRAVSPEERRARLVGRVAASPPGVLTRGQVRDAAGLSEQGPRPRPVERLGRAG